MQTADEIKKQIEKQAKEYAKLFDNGEIFKSVIYALQQGFEAGAMLYAAQDRWVKVSDVEPQKDVPYNIVYSGVVQWIAFKFDGENWVDMHDIAPALPKNDVSHYRPLPTNPKD